MKFVTETEFTLEEVMAIAQGDYFALAEQVGLTNLVNIDPRNTNEVAGILFDTLLARCGSEVAVYALEVWLAYRKSAVRFEKVDL